MAKGEDGQHFLVTFIGDPEDPKEFWRKNFPALYRWLIDPAAPLYTVAREDGFMFVKSFKAES